MRTVNIKDKNWNVQLEIDDSFVGLIDIMKHQLIDWGAEKDKIGNDSEEILRMYLLILCYKIKYLSAVMNKIEIIHALEEISEFTILNGKYGVKLLSVDKFKINFNNFIKDILKINIHEISLYENVSDVEIIIEVN